MTSYKEYRKGYTRVLAEEITTEAEVFSKWIRNVYSREVKDEIARLEKIANVVALYNNLGHEEFFDCFDNEAQAKKALETGAVSKVIMSEIEYRISRR